MVGNVNCSSFHFSTSTDQYCQKLAKEVLSTLKKEQHGKLRNTANMYVFNVFIIKLDRGKNSQHYTKKNSGVNRSFYKLLSVYTLLLNELSSTLLLPVIITLLYILSKSIYILRDKERVLGHKAAQICC